MRKDLDTILAEVDADDSLPNAPLAIPSQGGLTGSRPKVDPTEARERRVVMSACIQSGMSRDEIIPLFMKKYRMNEDAILSLRSEVVNIWADEDKEAISTSRGAARRRLLTHIHKAAKMNKWAAVAALEKVLSEVEGTIAEVPMAQPVADVGALETETLMRRMALKDPAQLRMVIERERVTFEMNDGALDAAPAVANIKPRAILGRVKEP